MGRRPGRAAAAAAAGRGRPEKVSTVGAVRTRGLLAASSRSPSVSGRGRRTLGGEGAWRPRRGGLGRRARVCSRHEALRPGRARPTPGAWSPRLQRGARPLLGGPCLPRRLGGRDEPPSGARPAAVGRGGRDG